MVEFDDVLERARLSEEKRLNALKPEFAWDGPMSLEMFGEKRTIPIRYAVESVYRAAQTPRDRILARGILAIFEELEKR